MRCGTLRGLPEVEIPEGLDVSDDFDEREEEHHEVLSRL